MTLLRDEVHVWRVNLAISPAEESRSLPVLSADERERAGRFIPPAARLQFVAARSALRDILGRYLVLPAETIAFCVDPLGKPSLANAGRRPPYFNLSHSRELALVAVTRCGAIGVDVESVREMVTREQLAERFFHPHEIATLQRLPAGERAASFFNAWTRKEAFLKATGKGIGFGIDRVEVTLAPGEPPRVLSIDGDPGAAAKWSLAAFQPAPDYVGAVALEGRWRRLIFLTR
jgi:4'-phosphopantetheinyl transferase